MLRAVCPAVVCLVLGSLGCRPEPTPVESPTAKADPGGPTGPTAQVQPDDPAGEPSSPETETETEPEPELESAPEPEPEAPEAEPEPEPKPTKTATREPLPKPLFKAGGGKCQQSFSVGDKVKSFKLPSVAGDKTISPAGYRNRVVLLNFWGTWCKPCLEELPEFDRLYRKYRRHGMTLVAVATDEDAQAVQAFIDEHKLVAKVALAGEAAAGEYGRSNFPFSFVIDGSGTIVAAYNFVDDKCLGDLEQEIRASLERL